MGEEYQETIASQEKIKHLEFIQSVITRMNTNSFQVKGLAITLVSAILAFAASTKEYNMLILAVIELVVFWHLDAYYLHQERLFRELYKEATGGNVNLIEVPKVDRESQNSSEETGKKKCKKWWRGLFCLCCRSSKSNDDVEKVKLNALKPFEINPRRYVEEGSLRYCCTFWSSTIIKLYLLLIIVVIGAFVLSIFFTSTSPASQ